MHCLARRRRTNCLPPPAVLAADLNSRQPLRCLDRPGCPAPLMLFPCSFLAFAVSERMATWVLWAVINIQVGRRAGVPSYRPQHTREGAHSRVEGRCCGAHAQQAPRSLERRTAHWGSGNPARSIQCCLPAPLVLQRKCDAYWEAQRERRWAKEVENFRNIDNSELRVGIMGLGQLIALWARVTQVEDVRNTPKTASCGLASWDGFASLLKPVASKCVEKFASTCGAWPGCACPGLPTVAESSARVSRHHGQHYRRQLTAATWPARCCRRHGRHYRRHAAQAGIPCVCLDAQPQGGGCGLQDVHQVPQLHAGGLQPAEGLSASKTGCSSQGLSARHDACTLRRPGAWVPRDAARWCT